MAEFFPNAYIAVHSSESRYFLAREQRAGADGVPPASARFMFIDFVGGITDDARPVWNPIETIGRPEKYLAYAGTENRTVAFQAQFYDQDEYGQAYKIVRWLRSLRYAWREDNDEVKPQLYFPPPKVEVRFTPPDAQTQMSIIGVVGGLRVTYRSPVDPQGGLPMSINTEISIISTTLTATAAAGAKLDPEYDIIFPDGEHTR